MTIQIGPRERPKTAAIAPVTPQNLEPTQTAKFVTFGPGTIWQMPSMALNSSELSHCSSSTMVRLAQGSTPPNPDRPILEKPIKSWRGVRVFKGIKNYCGLKGMGTGLWSNQASKVSVMPLEKVSKIGSAIKPKWGVTSKLGVLRRGSC